MKGFKTLLLLGFLSTVFAPQISASTPVAGEMAKMCSTLDIPAEQQTADQRYEGLLCEGYMSGLIDGMMGGLATAGGKAVKVDGKLIKMVSRAGTVEFVENMRYDQIARVFVKYVKDHPEIENHETAGEAINALVAAHLITVQWNVPRNGQGDYR